MYNPIGSGFDFDAIKSANNDYQNFIIPQNAIAADATVVIAARAFYSSLYPANAGAYAQIQISIYSKLQEVSFVVCWFYFILAFL